MLQRISCRCKPRWTFVHGVIRPLRGSISISSKEYRVVGQARSLATVYSPMNGQVTSQAESNTEVEIGVKPSSWGKNTVRFGIQVAVDDPEFREKLEREECVDLAIMDKAVKGFKKALAANPAELIQAARYCGEEFPSANRMSIESLTEVLELGKQLYQDPASVPDPSLSALRVRMAIYPLFAAYARTHLSSHTGAVGQLRTLADMRSPESWYPMARLSKRKFIYHGGPTNSGKTYWALQALKDANPEEGGGVFCGPLRLLALEVYESLNEQGVYCSLLTGQERSKLPFETHVACTIEMLDVNKRYDVAVIDEIQMIGHAERGWNWTRALLGLQANEIHLCGSLESLELVQRIIEQTGDELEVKEYDRMTSLRIAEEPLEDFSDVQPGDCIVAFSRANIFTIREAIENQTPHKCCVVYGQLPPETRSHQARLFNTEGSGYDVLVASDAIGMGLNLNIRRIIFHATSKMGDRGKMEKVDYQMMKQIAGRAGRRSSKFKFGEVTCLNAEDMPYLKTAVEAPLKQTKAAGLFPLPEHLELFASGSEGLKGVEEDQLNRLGELMKLYIHNSTFDQSLYFLVAHQGFVRVADLLHEHTANMPLQDRFTFCQAPVKFNEVDSPGVLKKLAQAWSTRRPMAVDLRFPREVPLDVVELTAMCIRHNLLDLYLWLANRYPHNFIDGDRARLQRAFAVSMIQKGLGKLKVRKSDMTLLARGIPVMNPGRYNRARAEANNGDGRRESGFGRKDHQNRSRNRDEKGRNWREQGNKKGKGKNKKRAFQK